MRIRISQDAWLDVNEGADFYERIRPALGTYFTTCLYADIDSLLNYAGIHAKIDGLFAKNSRSFPYVIWYAVESEEIVVYAVLDGRIDPRVIEWKLRYRRG